MGIDFLRFTFKVHLRKLHVSKTLRILAKLLSSPSEPFAWSSSQPEALWRSEGSVPGPMCPRAASIVHVRVNHPLAQNDLRGSDSDRPHSRFLRGCATLGRWWSLSVPRPHIHNARALMLHPRVRWGWGGPGHLAQQVCDTRSSFLASYPNAQGQVVKYQAEAIWSGHRVWSFYVSTWCQHATITRKLFMGWKAASPGRDCRARWSRGGRPPGRRPHVPHGRQRRRVARSAGFHCAEAEPHPSSAAWSLCSLSLSSFVKRSQ